MIYRARISATMASDMDVDSSDPNNIVVTTTNGSATSGDLCEAILPGIAVDGFGHFTIPNNTNKYWWIPFDDTDVPMQMPNNGQWTGGCACDNNSGGCTKQTTTNGWDCIPSGCTGNCTTTATPSTGPMLSGSFLVIAAVTLDYNGVLYS